MCAGIFNLNTTIYYSKQTTAAVTATNDYYQLIELVHF